MQIEHLHVHFLPSKHHCNYNTCFLCLSFRHKHIEREEQEKKKTAVTLWEAGNVMDEEKGIYQSLARKLANCQGKNLETNLISTSKWWIHVFGMLNSDNLNTFSRMLAPIISIPTHYSLVEAWKSFLWQIWSV